MTVPVRTGTVDVTMPQLGETVTEGTVTRWLKQVGDAVAAGEALFEVSTDKVDTEVPAATTGRVAEILVTVDETVLVGARVAVIEVGAVTPAAAARRAPADSPAAPRGDPPAAPSEPAPGRATTVVPQRQRQRHRPRHIASPRARRLLREHGLDESAVPGTGRGGRITPEDIAAVLNRSHGVPARSSTAAVSPGGSHPEATGFVAVQVDFHLVQATIERVRSSWEAAEGFPLGPLAFVARAAVDAIRRFPSLNTGAGASTPPERAVGLRVGAHAVIGEADDKRLAALARAIERGTNAEAAATIELRHPGRFGSLLSRPALTGQTTAVITLDEIVPTPVAIPYADGYAYAIRPIGTVALTYAGALIDADVATRFLSRIRHVLETSDWSDEL